MLMAMAFNDSVDELKRFNSSRNLDDFTYDNAEISGVFNENIRHTQFTGFSVSKQLNLLKTI